MHLVAFVCCLLAAAAASADVVHLDAAHDTMIFQSAVNNGAGGAPGFYAGTNAGPSIRRGLISFDVSSIPANATITSVQLQLKIGQVAGAPNVFSHPTIDLRKMLVSWGEANSGASNATDLGGIGQGSPAQPGDATWHARSFDSSNPTLWTDGVDGGKPGFDFSDSVSASLVQSDTLSDLSIWLSTPQLVADVQGWLGAGGNNFGWMLINENESSKQTFRGFYSRDFNPIPAPVDLTSYYPQLMVAYSVPEPTTLFLFVLGCGICLLARRRT